MKYVQAPSPGPVVDKKYRPFIPDSYRDYIPRMDETGVEYQKYMQGSPDAKKFQEKVLPQGSYQQEIPLSQDASPAQSGTPQLLAFSVSATAQHDENGASEGKHDAEPGFMKYMQAPSPGPVVDKKYRPFIPDSYRDYIPRMDETGVEYQKYMQGSPDAKKFQEKVLPQGSYQQEIPLSQDASPAQSGTPQLLASSVSATAQHDENGASEGKHDAEPGFMKYMQAPSPGPVVDKKYRPFIPDSYRDYIPRMDETGVEYQKYMQGSPDAKKFQEKVLPQGSYQQEIPLSQDASPAQSGTPQLLASSVSATAQHDENGASEGKHDAEPGFMKYMQAPSPGPVVDKKYRPFIPDSYRDYIPRMDETGVEYQKYMQGSPDAKKFQEKVLPQGSYQQEIPLSQDASPAQSGTPQLLASSVSATAQHDENGASEGKHDAEPGFMKYMQAPSPGPVVDKKYRPFIPDAYRDYIPRMDETGVEYQKYMQGSPDAKKFQEKVLPQGSYQQEIPLSQDASPAQSGTPQLLASSVSATAQHDENGASEGKHDAEPGFMKYMQAPSPGPVVDKKYRPFIPDSYRDYIPRMDETGVEYQKYMQGSSDAKKFQEKVLPQGSYQQEIPLSDGNGVQSVADPIALSAAEHRRARKAHTDKHQMHRVGLQSSPSCWCCTG